MMLTFRPIQNWPDGWQDQKERPNTPFQASYDATLKLLDDELYALGLGALRAVERYGIADRGQQYAGFSAIGRAMGADEGMDEERACRTLAEAAGLDRDTDPAVVRRMAKALYRDASKTYHPDRGGDAGIFANITRAYDVLTGDET